MRTGINLRSPIALSEVAEVASDSATQSFLRPKAFVELGSLSPV